MSKALNFVRPSEVEEAWIERLEDRSNVSVDLLLRIGDERVAVRLMVPCRMEALLDAVTTELVGEAKHE